MSTAIQVDALTVQYGQRRALYQVSLEVPAGSVLAVTGASGAGKTSLLWVVAGLLSPDEGRVVLSGTPVRTREDAVAEHVHLIPQGNGLASVLTAHENAAVALLAAGVDPAEAAERAETALEQLGVAAQG
ncbi:MAG: ABC transporter ATP-binding protein, partial [Stackebrandtia sp.]